MQKSYKILISAYACSPFHGSEPGMGWNFILELSKYHELHVIVEQRKWRKYIEEYLIQHPKLNKKIKFYFIEKKRNKFLRKIWPPSYYWFYKAWQKKAYKKALLIINENKIDLIHQLNMVGFREPGFLWKINKPFVWGPIGGLENSPWSFLPSLGIKGFVYYSFRNLINIFQRNFLIRPRLIVSRKNVSIISATPGNQRLIQKIWKKKSTVICEVGQEKIIPKISISKRKKNEPIKLVWSGKHIAGKNLFFLFQVCKKLKIPYELHILGDGPLFNKSKKLASNLNIEKNCKWYGWLSKQKANKVMKSGHVFCISSIKDLTSTVLLESISFGLPIIALDHCGFNFVVDKSCGVLVSTKDIKKAIDKFAHAITFMFENETYRYSLSLGSLSRSKVFSWNSKVNKLNSIYNNLITKS